MILDLQKKQTRTLRKQKEQAQTSNLQTELLYALKNMEK